MASSSKKKGSSAANRKEMQVQQNDSDETMTVDLMDPDDVLSKLDYIDDATTDILLKQAYEVNRELKKQLFIGKNVMDRRMTSSAYGSASQHRPRSNIIGPPIPPIDTGRSRMTSAASLSSTREAKSAVSNDAMKLAKVTQPVRISYHSQLRMSDV